MPWNDDSWRDGYDAWKLRSPDDDGPEPECLHEEYEIDMEGRAHCEMCGEKWWATGDEIAGQRERQIEHDAWCRKQERREFWRRLTYPIRWRLWRLFGRIWPRKAIRLLDHDDLPF